MTTTVTAQIVLRKGTASEWMTANPILASGEIGFELVTQKTKIGDGVTAWNSLPYHYDPNDSGVGAAIAAHEAAANPHPVYLTQTEGDAAYATLGHAHPIAGVTGLQTALDNKSATTHNHDSSYAPISNGVTNGDSHDHNGGDGGQIAYSSLSGLPSLGSAAAQNTTAFEASGAVATHAALTEVHGISSYFSSVVSALSSAAARIALGINGLASDITSATAKTTPADADELPMTDSSASFSIKKMTWGNIKNALLNPTSKLSIKLTTEQLRLLYDSSNYTSLTINSDGRRDETIVGATGSCVYYMKPDGTLWVEVAGQTAGNARGAGAVDLQVSRTASARVSSGANSFASGKDNTSSGQFSAVLCSNNVSSGQYSFSANGYNTASNFCATAFGIRAANAIPCSDAVGGGNSDGKAQLGRIPLNIETVDATPAVLNIFANATYRASIPAKAAWFFRAHLIAHTSTTTYRVAAWYITGVIARDGSNNTRIVGTPTVTPVVNESSWITTQPTVTADDTNDALAITVTGLAATTIRWTGGVYYTQALAA